MDGIVRLIGPGPERRSAERLLEKKRELRQGPRERYESEQGLVLPFSATLTLRFKGNPVSILPWTATPFTRGRHVDF